MRLQLTDDSKAARTTIHGLIKAAFPQLEAATVDVDGRKTIRLTASQGWRS